MKGRLFIIEGGDGSGKATQTRLLTEHLQRDGYDVKSVSYPDYDSDSSALVKMYLRGDFGSDADAVNPYAASAFFADNVTGMISAALSFVVIAAFWRANHVMFVHAHGYNRLVGRLQTLWLATIVFLPVATALDLAGPGTDRVGLGAYIGTMLLGGVILRVQAIALQRAGLSDRAPAPPLRHWIGAC